MYLKTYAFDKEQSCREHTDNTACSVHKQKEPVSLKQNMSELTHLSPDHHFSSSNPASIMKTQHETPNSAAMCRSTEKLGTKHTHHSQTIKQYTHTLLFASKLCHHVPLK